MTGLDTLTQPTRRSVEAIAGHQRRDSGESTSPGTSFDDVLARTSHDAEPASSRDAATPAADHAHDRNSDPTDTARTQVPGDAYDAAEAEAMAADAAESATPTETVADDNVPDAPIHMTQHVAADGTTPDFDPAHDTATDTPLSSQAAEHAATSGEGAAEADAALTAVPVTELTTAPAANSPSSTPTASPTTPTPAAPPTPTPTASPAATATASSAGANAAVDAVDVGEPPVETLPIVAAPSGVSADDATGGETDAGSGGDTALLQAAARAAENAAPQRQLDTQTQRASAVTAADPSATSDLAGLDTSSGDPVAPEVATLTAAQRGVDASTRLTEHVAMRDMFERIERHRSSIDGSIELEILTERFGAIRIEAAEGKDGVHLSLRGGNGDERALADLADELRQEFDRNGVDLAGLDVGDPNSGRSGTEANDDTADSLGGSGDIDAVGAAFRPLGGEAGRLDLRL